MFVCVDRRVVDCAGCAYRRSRQIGSVEAMLCRTKCGRKFSQKCAYLDCKIKPFLFYMDNQNVSNLYAEPVCVVGSTL